MLALESKHFISALIVLEPGSVAELYGRAPTEQMLYAGEDVLQVRAPVYEPGRKLKQDHPELARGCERLHRSAEALPHLA